MIDLHAHSRASDGSDSPGALMELAARAGLSAVALTDHDTLAGLEEARRVAEALPVRLVPGCELSCEVQDPPVGGMHLLVYFLEDGPGPLQDRLAGLRHGRDARNRGVVAVLRDHGMDVTVEEVLAEAERHGPIDPDRSVGRPHIAAVMVRKGFVDSIDEAFDRWLGTGRPAYLGRDRLTPGEAISLAHASGAVSVLAHPSTLGLEGAALEEFLDHLAGAGLDGLECEYGRYSPDERAAYRRLAEQFGLCPTGGSDYHGRFKPDLALGTGLGDLRVPDEFLEELETRRPF